MKPVLLDTSGIVALLDRSEANHQICVNALDELSRPLITCEAVIAESCHLLRRMPGAAEAVLNNIQVGVIKIPWSLTGRESRIHFLLNQYAKVPMSFADACLVCMAEDFAVSEILTLDSDFEFYRWNSRKTFTLLVKPAQRSKK